MRFDSSNPRRLGMATSATGGRGFFATLFAAIGGIVLIVLGLTFSLAILAVALVVGIIGFGYLWWKSRALRKQLAAQMENLNNSVGAGADPFAGQRAAASEQGDIIEGVVIREEREIQK